MSLGSETLFGALDCGLAFELGTYNGGPNLTWASLECDGALNGCTWLLTLLLT